MKKLGIMFLIVGIACLGISMYIKSEVEKGQQQVHKTQTAVDRGLSLFSDNEDTKEASETLASPIQKKIDEGKVQISTYITVVLWLRVIGTVLIVLGITTLFIRKKHI